MQATVELPKGFSVRDDRELTLIQDLMARLNPKLVVVPLATGLHVNGGCTVNWGLVYLDGQPLTDQDVQAALEEAGLDAKHCAEIKPSRIQPLSKGVTIMGGKTDVVKGRIKEAAGALTGNDRLRAEGKADQAVGEVKQAAAKVADKVKEALK